MPDLHLQPQLHSNTRYKQLDSLRGLAAIFVFISHYLGVFKTVEVWTRIQATPLGVFSNGHAAVIFFFILSGFVISLPFVNNDRPLELVAFYVKRIFRIYPAFYVVTALALIFKLFVFDKTHMVEFSPWLQTFWTWDWNKASMGQVLRSLFIFGPGYDQNILDPAIWSLVIEVHMSILLPFFIVIAAKTKAKFAWIFAIALMYCTYKTKVEPINVFFLGILLAKYKNYFVDIAKKLPIWAIWALGVLAILLYNGNYEHGEIPGHPLLNYLAEYTMGIGSCIIIIIAISSKRLTTLLEKRFFTFFGDISYGFYLLHMPILFVTCSLVSYHSTLSYIYILIASLGLSIITAALMFNYIEIPFQTMAKIIVKKYKALNTIDLM